MKKYKGMICFPMWQEVVVEAKDIDDAFDKICDKSDFTRSSLGEVYVSEVELLEAKDE
jgi:hypothetical protein